MAVVGLRGAAALALTLGLALTAALAAPPDETMARGAVAPRGETTGVVELPNVLYGSAVNSEGVRQQLRLDLFLPPDTGDLRPAVVLAHGGGFRRGGRKDARIRRLALALAKRGYVAASISYRLRPRASRVAAPDPRILRDVSTRRTAGAARDAQHDLQAAVRYLRRHRATFDVDRRQIVAMGSSAGGIAALRAAFNPESPGRSGNPGFSSRVTAVVALWAAAHPRMIERGAPPALMFHGKADTTVPFRLGRRTCRATRQRGNLCRGVWWAGEGHAAWHRTPEIIRTTSRYLARRLDG